MSDVINNENETQTWAQLYALRGGWREPRRDGHEFSQTCRRGHAYESDNPEPRCPTCESVFTEADFEREAFRAQDRRVNWWGFAVSVLILSLFAWALWSGVDEQGRVDDSKTCAGNWDCDGTKEARR